MSVTNVVWLLVVIVASAFFAYNVQRLVSYLRLGLAEDRTNDVLTRFTNVLEIGIFQKKIFRDSVAGPMHAAIFWGFCVLTIGTAEFVVRGIVPAFSLAQYLPAWLDRFYEVNQDLWGALVIGAVAMALWRRLTKRVARLQGAEAHVGDPLLILSWIGALMVTMLRCTRSRWSSMRHRRTRSRRCRARRPTRWRASGQTPRTPRSP